MNSPSAKARTDNSAKPQDCWDLSWSAFRVTLTLYPEVDLGLLAENLEPRIFNQPADPDQAVHYVYACYQAYRQEQELKRTALRLVSAHLGYTIPDPGRPGNWRRRLLPAGFFSEYKESFRVNQELRLNATLKLAETYHRILEIQATPHQPNITLTDLTHSFREAARCAFQCDPAPTPAEYLAEQAKARAAHGRNAKPKALLPPPVRQILISRQNKQDLARYNQTQFQLGLLPDFSQADPILRRYLPPSGFHQPIHYQAWHFWSHLPGVYHWKQWRGKKRQTAYNPTVSKNQQFL